MKEIMEPQETEPQKERSKEIHHLEDWDGNPISVMTDIEDVVEVKYGASATSVLRSVEIKNEKGEWNLHPSMIKKGDILYYFNTDGREVFLNKLPAYGEYERRIDEGLIPAAQKAGVCVEEIE